MTAMTVGCCYIMAVCILVAFLPYIEVRTYNIMQ